MLIAQSKGLAEAVALVIIVVIVKEALLVTAHHLSSKGNKLKFYWLCLILRNHLRARKIKNISKKAKNLI